MATWLMEFMKALEIACPPGAGKHHAIGFCRYGSDAEGWRDRLGLHVWIGEVTQTFFLDDADFQRSTSELVADVVSKLPAVGADGH